MRRLHYFIFCTLFIFNTAHAQIIKESWDYAPAMREAAQGFTGTEGVVLHIGDSITYSNPYGQWARYGKGKTPEDETILRWMHTGEDNDLDGWYLARFDHPDGGRSYTAVSGIRSDEYLRGGKRHIPPLREVIRKYNPQVVVLMLGTNDASANRSVAAYRRDMEAAVDLILANNTIPILSTIPPHPGRRQLAESYSAALIEIARERKLPLIDFYGEIIKRRRNDWNGTLLGKNDVHPTARQGGATPSSAPTDENLRNSGYLLRGWLSVKKIKEVKKKVLDDIERKVAAARPDARAQRPPGPTSHWPPNGQKIKLSVSRDSWVSCAGRESDCNLGKSTRLKTKAYQEMTLVDFDAAKLRGRVIVGALLHLRAASKDPQKRVSVSTLASEWVEGASTSYKVEQGSSCFSAAEYGKRPWAYPGSDITAVMMGEGNTIWRHAEATPPDRDGWQTISVEPAVIAARAAGISYGCVVFDDTGSEWQRNGESFTPRVFPNRFLHSREAGQDSAPYFTVWLSDSDDSPPDPVSKIRSDSDRLPPGEAIVSWLTPPDEGVAGTLGFFVRVTEGNRFNWNTARDMPRYLIPMAAAPGGRVRMRLHDADLTPGATYTIGVRAVDAAGNIGAVVTAAVVTSSHQVPHIGGRQETAFTKPGVLPKLGDAEVFVLDPLDKVNPVTGETIPPQPKDYLSANHLWSAKERLVRLFAARNEFVAFQIVIKGGARGVTAKLDFDEAGRAASLTKKGANALLPRLLEFRYVSSKKGLLPDPLVPHERPFDLPVSGRGGAIPGQRFAALLAEVYIPHAARAGKHTSALILRSTAGEVSLAVEVNVWAFTLPDALSFIPEMNCYGLPRDGERGYYRVAHEHRTCINRLPYSQSGNVHDGCAPGWNGKQLNWSAWDKRFGPYLNGKAFSDLPRAGAPLPTFYLPLHENWPGDVFKDYNGSYWADEAFPESYRQTFVDASRQIAEHFREKGWTRTLFECYLNNKNSYKRRGWSRGSSPWLLDEPASFQDFWALRYFALAFHEGVSAARGRAKNVRQPARVTKVVFRCDISRPQWQRDSLRNLLDVNVCGRAFRRYRRMVLDRKESEGQVLFEYGSSNPIEESNIQPAGWCLDAWCLGADGVLPWQTVGGNDSWRKADQLSLFYPGGAVGKSAPMPSIRLKSYRRGQQDVEYLVLLTRLLNEPRWAVGESVRRILRLSGVSESKGGEDAGIINFRDLTPRALWELRTRVGGVVSAARPAAKRQLTSFDTPARDVSNPRPGYVSIGPPRQLPAETAAGAAKTITIQGRPIIHDAIIDFSQPDKSFGSVPRDNRIIRQDRSNAFLIKFDLKGAELPSLRSRTGSRDAQLDKAVLSFYVWDPSSRGASHVCAFRVTSTNWDESSVTWKRPATNASWKGNGGFSIGVDTDGNPVADATVHPDQGRDTVEPPLEYQIDVTEMVRGWLKGDFPNYGLALSTIADRAVDDGEWTRFQVLASEYARKEYTPKLTLQVKVSGGN